MLVSRINVYFIFIYFLLNNKIYIYQNIYSSERSCVYVTNLSRYIKESELEEKFIRFGDIKNIKIVKDPFTHESRGFAFVTYEKNSAAEESIKEMSGSEILGRTITCEISKRNRERTSTPGIYLGPSSAKRLKPRYDNRDNRNYHHRSRSRSYGRRRRYDSRSPDRRNKSRSRERERGGERSRSFSKKR